MQEIYEIDSLDRKILQALKRNARRAFTDIAKELIIAPSTVHLRVDKLKETGVIKGSTLVIDETKLGFDVCAFLGIHLKSSKDLPIVLTKLKNLAEVTEVHYTTGNYALLVKVQTYTIKDFYHFLANKLQTIKEVQSTESFISLDQPIHRGASLEHF